MKKILLFIILILLAYFGWNWARNFFFPPSAVAPENHNSTIQIGETIYKIDIVDTDNLRAKGLSGRKNLAEDTGMLFIFDKKDVYSFWMKDMNFPLDFVWINDDIITDLTENVPVPLTNTYTPTISPKSAVNRVLEINSGQIKKHELKIGQKVNITLIEPFISP